MNEHLASLRKIYKHKCELMLEQIEKKIKQDDIFAQTIREITININSKN